MKSPNYLKMSSLKTENQSSNKTINGTEKKLVNFGSIRGDSPPQNKMITQNKNEVIRKNKSKAEALQLSDFDGIQHINFSTSSENANLQKAENKTDSDFASSSSFTNQAAESSEMNVGEFIQIRQ